MSYGLDVGRIRLVRGARRGKRDDEEVFEDAARIAGLQRARRRFGTIQRLAKINLTAIAKRRDRLTRLGVDLRHHPVIEVDEPSIAAVGALPVVDAARADRALVLVYPQFLARRGIERDDGVPLACTYITPSTTIGLNTICRSPTGYLQATSSFETVFLLIWSSAVYCEESLPPRYCVQVVYGFGLAPAAVARAGRVCAASVTATVIARCERHEQSLHQELRAPSYAARSEGEGVEPAPALSSPSPVSRQ
jgi:hypothetical protein